jgi:hypothetical protein
MTYSAGKMTQFPGKTTNAAGKMIQFSGKTDRFSCK